MAITLPVGSDGHVPILDTTGLWRILAYHQTYFGKEGEGRWIANPGDFVIDITSFTWYRVVSVNQTTLVPTLEPIALPLQTSIPETDPYVAMSAQGSYSLWYVYLNDTVTPNVLNVENRFRIEGSEASYAKLFRGTNIGASGECLSRIYDQYNNLIDEKIPLELAEMDSARNYTVRHVEPFYTASTIADHERVTLVVYSDTNNVIEVREMVIVKTGLVATPNDDRDWIENVTLQSPFILKSDPTTLQIPVNVPLASLNLQALITYRSGRTSLVNVDGTVARVTGLDSGTFVATKVGESFQILLHYYLQSNEYSFLASNTARRSISKQYTCKVVRPEGAYNIKLFGFPRWVDETTGYRFVWWVGNMERTLMMDVTGLVRVNENQTAFDGRLYGMVQRVTATIDFQKINPSWTSTRFVQTMDVTLDREGSDHSATNWELSFNPDNLPVYGIGTHVNAHMVNENLWQVDLTSGCVNMNDWLTKFYYNLLPMKDYYASSGLPAVPTHFIIVSSLGVEYEFPIEQWSNSLTINSALNDSDTMILKFIKKTQNQSILYLAVGGVPIWNV